MNTTIRRVFLALGLAAASFGLAGCGDPVEVPSAHVGKISTDSGFQEGILPPSKLRLSSWCFTCDSLVLAEVSDYAIEEQMTLFTKDDLNITFDVRGTFATSEEPKDLEMIFNRVSSQPIADRVALITADKVYNTYAKQIIRERVRSVMSKYSIDEIMDNRDKINAEIASSVVAGLEGRPVKVLNFGLADIQPPKVIVDAEERAKQREIDIATAEADKEIRIRKAEADLNVAELQQAVELKQAETDVLVEQKLAEGFNRSFLMRRGLAALEAMAASDNKVIFLPNEAFSNPALLMGAFNQADIEAADRPVADLPASDVPADAN